MSGATLGLHVELLGASRVGLAFSELLLRGANLHPVMDEIGSLLVATVAHRFAEEEGPDGEAWTPSRRAEDEGGVTLTDSARLRHSITHSAGATKVEIGTNLVYAGIHQFGGTITKHAASMPIHRRQADIKAGVSRFARRSKADFVSYHEVGEHTITMPARPFLGVSKADEREIEALLEGYLMRGVR